MRIPGNEPGGFPGVGSAFMKCPAPGSKKSMGETLWLELMPLQPAAHSPNTASIASCNKFRFNLTGYQYKTARHDGNF